MKAFTKAKPWTYASNFCQNGGGLLAQPKNNVTMYGVLEAISIQGGKEEYWIGGHKSDVSDSFVWDSDGSIVDGDNWAHGFPMSGWRIFFIICPSL